MKGATGGLNLTFAPTAIAGTDTVNVTLDGTTSGALNAGANVENVVLTTKNSAATLTNFTAANATTVATKGGQGFKLDAANSFATTTTIDAREAGKAEFTAAAATVAVLTGSSNDTITKGTAAINGADLFNLGAGTDTLVVNVATGAAATATYIGVENIIAKTTGVMSFDMTKALSWLLGIASPSKVGGGNPNKCMIANCNGHATHKGLHYLLNAIIHVCRWHLWTIRPKSPLTADDRLTLGERLAQSLQQPPPTSHL